MLETLAWRRQVTEFLPQGSRVQMGWHIAFLIQVLPQIADNVGNADM